LQTDAHQHFEVNRRLNNKLYNQPGISGSGAPAPPSNSASIQESSSALESIIASSFKNVANRSFDTSGVTRILHDVDTDTEATIPADPSALHRYNDIVANPDIAYDIICRSVESHATLETDNELNSQDVVRMYDFVRKGSYPKP
jgi:hypothetical protein